MIKSLHIGLAYVCFFAGLFLAYGKHMDQANNALLLGLVNFTLAGRDPDDDEG